VKAKLNKSRNLKQKMLNLQKLKKRKLRKPREKLNLRPKKLLKKLLKVQILQELLRSLKLN